MLENKAIDLALLITMQILEFKNSGGGSHIAVGGLMIRFRPLDLSHPFLEIKYYHSLLFFNKILDLYIIFVIKYYLFPPLYMDLIKYYIFFITFSIKYWVCLRRDLNRILVI